jgi:3-(3-hydroxy-phenyl)propionate hydroxylase
VLLNLAEPGRFSDAVGYERLSIVDAHHDGTWELPVVGNVTSPYAVLIRPDGYVAWVDTEGSPTGLNPNLTKALAEWVPTGRRR